MVRFLGLLAVALIFASCASVRRPADGPAPRDPADGDEIVQAGGDEPDRAQRDFEIAEFLDRLDPVGGRRVRTTCRVTEGGISLEGAERSDGCLTLGTDRCKALARVRRTEDAGEAISWYLSANALSGAARLHAGSFVPDFALGLVFGGSGGASLSSSVFPFNAPRRIAGTTSFYLQTLRGGAAEIRSRNVYAAIFEGRPVTYGSNGPETGERMISGARIEARRGGAEIGLSASTGASGSGRGVCGVDGRWRSARMNAGFEAGFGGAGEPGLLSGFSYGGPGARAAFLLYSVPPGAAGVFGSANGRTTGDISSIGGVAVVGEREIFRRVRARASIDRYERADGLREKLRRTTRLECERRGKKSVLRLTWIGAEAERRDFVPYPPAGESALESSRSLAFFSEWRLARKTSIGLALKRIEETDGLGWLVSPIFRADLLSARLRVAASFAAYRTSFGHPVCYFYEPALPGSFPLRIVSRDTGTGAIVIDIYINKISVLARAALEAGRAPEISLQAKAGL